jgi:hypothetical protein
MLAWSGSVYVSSSRFITPCRMVGAILSLTASQAAPQTIEQFTTSWARGMDRECRVIQRAAAENQNLSDNQIAQYCNCVARHSVEVITMDELLALQQTGQRPQSMQHKLNALGQTCAEVLSGRTRDDGPIR